MSYRVPLPDRPRFYNRNFRAQSPRRHPRQSSGRGRSRSPRSETARSPRTGDGGWYRRRRSRSHSPLRRRASPARSRSHSPRRRESSRSRSRSPLRRRSSRSPSGRYSNNDIRYSNHRSTLAADAGAPHPPVAPATPPPPPFPINMAENGINVNPEEQETPMVAKHRLVLKTRYMNKLSSDEPRLVALGRILRGSEKRLGVDARKRTALSVFNYGAYKELHGEARCTNCKTYQPQATVEIPDNCERWPCGVAASNSKCIACIVGAFQNCDPELPEAGEPLRPTSTRLQAKFIASTGYTVEQPEASLPVTAEPSERKRRKGERVAETIGTCVKSLQEAQESAARLGDLDSGRDALEHASKFLEMALTEYEQLAQM